MYKTPFGNNFTWKLNDSILIDKLCSLYYDSSDFNNNRFPGPQPKSIERRNFHQLQNNAYWVCEKTDGLRFLFVCFLHDGRNYSFLVNRKNEIFLLNFELSTLNFNNTILDGELIKSNFDDSYHFLIFDAIIVNNIKLHTKLYHERMSFVDLVSDKYIKKSTDPFCITKKLVHKYDKTLHLSYNSMFNSDGFIFTPDSDHIQSGTHDNMFKFKKQLDNSVDFEINFENNFYVLYIGHKVLQHNYINLHSSVLDHDILSHIRNVPHSIVECKFSHSHGRSNFWIPLLVRKDKNHSNSFFCFKKTMLNIHENIQLDELFPL